MDGIIKSSKKRMSAFHQEFLDWEAGISLFSKKNWPQTEVSFLSCMLYHKYDKYFSAPLFHIYQVRKKILWIDSLLHSLLYSLLHIHDIDS